MFIRCEKQSVMHEGRVLIPGGVMEVSEETLASIQHLIDAEVITVHSSDPNAVRKSRKEKKPVPTSSTLQPSPLSLLKKSELLLKAKMRGIPIKGNETKAAIIEKLSQGG